MEQVAQSTKDAIDGSFYYCKKWGKEDAGNRY